MDGEALGTMEAGLDSVVEQPVEQVETAEATESTTEQEQVEQKPEEKVDGRKTPDSIRKRIAELKRSAESIADPAAKAALLADAKALTDGMGKLGGYEQVFPTVREAREFKALLDTVGGREGFTQIQETIANVERIDSMLEAGDPRVLEHLWKEAGAGIQKLVPAIVDRLAKENPEAYQRLIVPQAMRFFDQSGFPQAFDRMVGLVSAGKTQEAMQEAERMIAWYTGQRSTPQQAQEKQTDPEREKFERERKEWEEKRHTEEVNRTYSGIIEHAGPVIDTHLKPLVASLKLSAEQYNLLREDVWSEIQKTRNADATYKTVSQAKVKQGMDKFAEYAKGETQSRAKAAAEKMAKLRYGHLLKAGAPKPKPTDPVVPGVMTGKQPAPSEIDYSPKGIAAARKAGFRDVGEMILAGQAPLKSGGIRKWR